MSRTSPTAAPGGWTLYWEFRDPGGGWGGWDLSRSGAKKGGSSGPNSGLWCLMGRCGKGQGHLRDAGPEGGETRPEWDLHVVPTLVLKHLVNWG